MCVSVCVFSRIKACWRKLPHLTSRYRNDHHGGVGKGVKSIAGRARCVAMLGESNSCSATTHSTTRVCLITEWRKMRWNLIEYSKSGCGERFERSACWDHHRALSWFSTSPFLQVHFFVEKVYLDSQPGMRHPTWASNTEFFWKTKTA